MSDHDDFVTWVRTVLVPADTALHDGDPEPRKALYSRHEPVSILGAWQSVTSPAQAQALFDGLAADFSDCTGFDYELVQVEVAGDLAYTAGYEHTSCSVRGVPREYTLRVTQVYRREDGEWRVAHRHGSAPPEGPAD